MWTELPGTRANVRFFTACWGCHCHRSIKLFLTVYIFISKVLLGCQAKYLVEYFDTAQVDCLTYCTLPIRIIFFCHLHHMHFYFVQTVCHWKQLRH